MPEPYYEDDFVTLYHGDGVEIAANVHADVLITDPPYGTGYYAHDIDGYGELAELVKRYKSAAVFGYPEALVGWCSEQGLVPDEWITWWPTNKASGHRGKGLARETEHIAVFGLMPGAKDLMRPRAWQSENRAAEAWVASRGLDKEEAREGDVWRDPAPGMGFNHRQRRHPNEKPLGVMTRLVRLLTKPGEVVLDPFAGSGTTLRAAKDLGRRAVGVEIDEAHCAVAAERMTQDVLDVEAAA